MRTFNLPFHRQLTLVNNKSEYARWVKENCIEDESAPGEYPAVVYFTVGSHEYIWGQVVAKGGVQEAIRKLEELEMAYNKKEGR